MALVLTNEDMERLELSPAEIYAVVEQGYRDLAAGSALSPPRRRMYAASHDDGEQRTYWFNNIMGIVPSYDAVALRIDSVFGRTVVDDAGTVRRMRVGDFVGLVLLFDLRTAELTGILHDHYLSTRRVAATSAIGVKYMAREDSRVLGLFGSGEQARAHVLAICDVRPIEVVKVFSPTEQHRRSFAAEMAELSGRVVVAVDHPEEAVEGCDIVATATSSRTPVFDGTWLDPGTHVVTIVAPSKETRGTELDAVTVDRADVVVVNSKEQILVDEQPKLLEAIERGSLGWDDIAELHDVLVEAPGRRSGPDEITLHDNNTGMGIQFASLGALIMENARAHGLGTDLNDDLFMTRGGSYSP